MTNYTDQYGYYNTCIETTFVVNQDDFIYYMCICIISIFYSLCNIYNIDITSIIHNRIIYKLFNITLLICNLLLLIKIILNNLFFSKATK
jgi:hypothetical protein